MEWTPEKLAKARFLLAEDKAVLVQKGAVAFAAGAKAGARRTRQKIVRLWPQISDKDRALCDAYLLEYASAANDAPGNIVHGPKTDRETFTGDWRAKRTDLSRLKTDPREQGVYQTLVFPADSSGADGDWASEETHLNHVHTEASTGDAPAEIPCRTPPQGVRLSVVARLDKETGEWDSEKRTDEARNKKWEYSDGDALATTTHKREEHADAPPATPSPTPGKAYRVNADVDEYGTFRTQVDETTAQKKTTGPYTASKTPLQTVTAEAIRNAETIPAAGENETVSARVNELGLLDVEKHTTTPIEKAIDYTASETALEKTVEKSVRNAAQAPNAAPGETVSARLNEHGKVDYDKRTTTPKPADATVEAREWSEKTVTKWYRNQDAEQEAIPGVGGQNAITTGGHAQPNEHGKFDGSVQITDPIERESAEATVEHGPLRKVTSKFHFNKPAVPPASSSGGTAVTYHPRVNRFGLWDFEERKASAGTGGTDSWKKITCVEWWTEKVYTLEFRNWTDVPDASAFPASGDALRAFARLSGFNVNLNELGLFDGSVQLTVPVEQHTDEITVEDSAQRTVTVKNYFNQRTAPVNRPQTSALGGDKSVTTFNARPNRFGLWDYEERRTTFKKLEGTEYISEEAFFESATTQQKLNQTVPEKAESQDGKIQTVHNRLTDAGSYDSEIRTESAKAKNTPEIIIEDSPERKVTIQHFRNKKDAPSGAGHNTSTNLTTSFSGVQLNRFGLYDFTKVKTTGKGRYGFSSGSKSWTFTVGRGYGVVATTTVTRQGSDNPDHRWTATLHTWGPWTTTATRTVTACKSYGEAAAVLGAISPGSGNNYIETVHGADIEGGGDGIWYAVYTIYRKQWTLPSSGGSGGT